MRSSALVAGGLAAGLLAGFLVWGSGPGTTPRGTNAFDSDPGGQKARIKTPRTRHRLAGETSGKCVLVRLVLLW